MAGGVALSRMLLAGILTRPTIRSTFITPRDTVIRSTSIALASLVLALAYGRATAQPEIAQAEHLFHEGKRLMEEGNLAEACGAFEASYGKAPAVSTLLNLANCREKNHQYASAWGYFIEAARLTRGKPDEATYHKTATERAAAIENRLSYLIINVPADGHVDGLVITLNGKPVAEGEWNRKVPVDGGSFKIEGKAPAHEPWSTTVTVAAAKDTQSVTVPRFHPLSSPGVDPTRGGSTPARGAPWYADRLGWGLAGGGLVIAATGAALLMQAASAEDEANNEPVLSRRQELRDRADSRRTLGFVAAGIGGGLLVAGVAKLWVHTSEETPVEIAPGPGEVGLAMSLRF